MVVHHWSDDEMVMDHRRSLYTTDPCIMDTYIMDIFTMDATVRITNTCIMDISAWVTQPERLKGVKDDLKQARNAQSQPEGPQARS